MSPPVAFAAVAVLVVAGAAWGLSTLLGGGSRAPRTTPPAPLATAATPNPPASPAVSTRQVNWLGMNIITQPPGIAVVQTVALGTAADRAGINPGDVIVSINGRSITSATDIPAALRGLAAGSQVTLQLAYGSDVSQAELALGKPPSISP
ncbi:MAG TPA: PDZ domain-containing protein [Solirubrobacteraceae bacterium]|nr:PDZ domain-containing protein [Solirubrobacteraceae bacterium]